MLTLFAAPKPFEGRTGLIQRNAIKSWLRLMPPCEIILCGDEKGIEQTSREFQTRFIPDVDRNEHGTPLINSIFAKADQTSSTAVLCYINADIMLLDDFIATVRFIPFTNYLMIGQRWDLSLEVEWNFELPDWQDRLKNLVGTKGSLHATTGMDYFAFPRGAIVNLPPFAVGRPAWDNWMVYQARTLGIPVIDATRVTTVVHQNHEYGHVKQATDNTTEGPEALANRKLAGGWDKMFDVKDATHILKPIPFPSSNSARLLCKNWRTVPVPLLRTRKKLEYLAGAGVRALRRRLMSVTGEPCGF